MLRVLSAEESWCSAMAEAFEGIGHLHAVDTLTEEQLRQYMFDLFKPRFDSYFITDQDGDTVMLGKGGYDKVMEIGWDEYDKWCKSISGIDRRANKKDW